MGQLIEQNIDGYSYHGIPGVIGGNIVSPIIDLGGPTKEARIEVEYAEHENAYKSSNLFNPHDRVLAGTVSKHKGLNLKDLNLEEGQIYVLAANKDLRFHIGKSVASTDKLISDIASTIEFIWQESEADQYLFVGTSSENTLSDEECLKKEVRLLRKNNIINVVGKNGEELPPLYSLPNGVADEVDLVSGEGQENTGLITFTGNELWWGGSEKTDTMIFNHTTFADIKYDTAQNTSAICTHFDIKSIDTNDIEGMRLSAVGQNFFVRIKKSTIGIDGTETTETQRTTKLRAWLAAQYANGTPLQLMVVRQTPEPLTIEPTNIPLYSPASVISTDKGLLKCELENQNGETVVLEGKSLNLVNSDAATINSLILTGETEGTTLTWEGNSSSNERTIITSGAPFPFFKYPNYPNVKIYGGAYDGLILSLTHWLDDGARIKGVIVSAKKDVFSEVDTTPVTFEYNDEIWYSTEKSPNNPHRLVGTENATVTVSGKNLFDKDSIIVGEDYSASTGDITENSGAYRTPYIPVRGLTDYYLSGITDYENSFVAYYTEDKEFIGRTSANKRTEQSFTTPANCKYIGFSQYKTSTEVTGQELYDMCKDTLQLELGTAATEYEPYVFDYRYENPIVPNSKIIKQYPTNESDKGIAGEWSRGPIDSTVVEKYTNGQWENYYDEENKPVSFPFGIYRFSSLQETLSPIVAKTYVQYRVDPTRTSKWEEYNEILGIIKDKDFSKLQYRVLMITADTEVSPEISSIRVQNNNSLYEGSHTYYIEEVENLNSYSAENIDGYTAVELTSLIEDDKYTVPLNPGVNRLQSTASGSEIKIDLRPKLEDSKTAAIPLRITFNAFLKENESIALITNNAENTATGRDFIIRESGSYEHYIPNETDHIIFKFSNSGQGVDSICVYSDNKYSATKEFTNLKSSPTYYDNKGEYYNNLVDEDGDEVNIVYMKTIEEEERYTTIFEDSDIPSPYWLNMGDKGLVESSIKVNLEENFKKENPLVNISIGYDEMRIIDGGSLQDTNLAIRGGAPLFDDEISSINIDFLLRGGSLAASEEYKIKVQDLNRKHTQYRSGNITIEDIGGIEEPFLRTFSPSIDLNEEYACYLALGWAKNEPSAISTSWVGVGEEDASISSIHRRVYHTPSEVSNNLSDIIVNILPSRLSENDKKVTRLSKTNNYEALLNHLYETEKTDYERKEHNVIPEYISERSYNKHDLVTHDGKYYSAIKETSEDLDSDDWEEIMINYSHQLRSLQELEGDRNVPLDLIHTNRINSDTIGLKLSSEYKGTTNVLALRAVRSYHKEGRCTSQLEYISEWMNLAELVNQTELSEDLSSVSLRLSLSNPKLKGRIERRTTNSEYKYRVVVSSENYNPRINYNPTITGGKYNIGNQEYLFLPDLQKVNMEDSLLPVTNGVKYIATSDGHYANKPKEIINLLGEIDIVPINQNLSDEYRVFDLPLSPYPNSELFPRKYIHPIESEQEA